MNCHYCGAEITGQEIFCRCCGTRQNPVPVEEPPVAEEIVPAACEESAPIPEETFPVIPVPAEQPFAWKSLEETAPPNVAPLFGLEETPLPSKPRIQLPVKRGLGKMIFLGILTLGIYPMVIWSRLVGEVNMAASRYDGERSMSFFGMLMLAPITLGIHTLVWFHKLCRRIGAELERRNIAYIFGARDFWIWNFLLAFLFEICVGAACALYVTGFRTYGIIWALLAAGLLALAGPFVFIHKLMKAMNHLNENFNTNG